IDPADDLRAVIPHPLGPERALLAGDALHQHGVISADDHARAPFAAATAAFTASSMRSCGSIPSRSRTIAIASSSPVPWIVKTIGIFGFSSSQALTTPSAMTSVRAKAPQKLTSNAFTLGFASTISSAGMAFV